jgi:hypothetical protein
MSLSFAEDIRASRDEYLAATPRLMPARSNMFAVFGGLGDVESPGKTDATLVLPTD